MFAVWFKNKAGCLAWGAYTMLLAGDFLNLAGEQEERHGGESLQPLRCRNGRRISAVAWDSNQMWEGWQPCLTMHGRLIANNNLVFKNFHMKNTHMFLHIYLSTRSHHVSLVMLGSSRQQCRPFFNARPMHVYQLSCIRTAAKLRRGAGGWTWR